MRYSIALVILIFTFGSLLQAEKFGDDNESGGWLPIPDGYVWPKAAVKAPKFNPVGKKFSQLDEGQQKVIMGYWFDEKTPEQVEIAMIDLNGDGRQEMFVGTPGYSGTGGVFYEIFSTKDGMTYRSIGGIQGWGVEFRLKKDGWLQIEGMSRGGGGHYTRYLMTFGKEGYEMSRNEGHDFNNKKVTIRKTNREESK